VVIGRLCVCVKRTLVLACRGDSSELTLGLFYLISEIIFTFLLHRDCRFAYCFVLIVDLSLTTVLLIIQSFILIHSVIKLKIA